MFFVICPTCQTPVEIPGIAVGPDRQDLFNVVECEVCLCGFDYDDEDVMDDADRAAN